MPSKPGYKTSEFWLSVVAMALAAIFASGAVVDQPTAAKVMEFVAGVIAAMGYSYQRYRLKKGPTE